MRILEKAHSANGGNHATLKVAAIAIDDVVKYDIENLKIEMNSDFKFQQILEGQLPRGSINSGEVDFSAFSSFGARLVPEAVAFINGLTSPKDVQKMDSMVQKLYQVLQVK